MECWWNVRWFKPWPNLIPQADVTNKKGSLKYPKRVTKNWRWIFFGDIAPKSRPSQKEISSPIHYFQGDMLVLGQDVAANLAVPFFQSEQYKHSPDVQWNLEILSDYCYCHPEDTILLSDFRSRSLIEWTGNWIGELVWVRRHHVSMANWVPNVLIFSFTITLPETNSPKPWTKNSPKPWKKKDRLVFLTGVFSLQGCQSTIPYGLIGNRQKLQIFFEFIDV